MSNLQMLLRHLGHWTSQQSWSEVHADAYLDRRNPTSDHQGLTSAFLHLSTSVNTSPVHLLAARTLPRVSTCSNLSPPANTTALTSNAPSRPLGARTALVLLTPANTTASTSNAPSRPIGVRTLPVPPITSLQALPRKKKYYVIIVGKCTGEECGLCYGVKRRKESRSGTSQNPQTPTPNLTPTKNNKSHVL